MTTPTLLILSILSILSILVVAWSLLRVSDTAETKIVERDLRAAAAGLRREILAYQFLATDTVANRAGKHHLLRYQIRMAAVAEPLPLEPSP